MSHIPRAPFTKTESPASLDRIAKRLRPPAVKFAPANRWVHQSERVSSKVRARHGDSATGEAVSTASATRTSFDVFVGSKPFQRQL